MSNLKIAACIAAIALTAGVAVAQDFANIVVGGEVVARIRTGGPHGSIYARQARIDQRVVQALSDERPHIFVQALGGPDLKVYQSEGRWTLGIGNTMLIQAFPEDAVGTTTQALIHQWRENFKRQLPRACSPIHVPQWWRDANPDATGTTEKRMHNLPAEDAVLVREVAEILEDTRQITNEQFEARLPAMERTLIEWVWAYRHPSCGAPPMTEHIRAKSALKRARGLSDTEYGLEKWWMAGLTIERLRDAMKMPAGVGPVPEQRDLPDFDTPIAPVEAPVAPEPVRPEPAAPTPATPEPAAAGQAELLPGTPIERVAIATGLGPDNALLNVGEQFDADTPQLLVYLQLKGAARNTIVGVALAKDDGIVARRLVRVSGDRRMAVTFYPARATAFASGDYQVRLTINGEDAGHVPFRIGADTGILMEG
ncbi:MAG: hypothetical protein ACOX9R_07030 [Armatimonadota bacterium]